MNTLTRSDYWRIEKHELPDRKEPHPALMITRRRVKPGCRAAFDDALRTLVAFAVPFPGHIDVHVLCRICGRSCECAVAHRFADSAARAKFTSSPEYFQWLGRLRALTDGSWVRGQSGEEGDAGVPLDQSAESRSKSRSTVEAALVFVLVPMFLGLPLAVYLLLANWHPFARLAAATTSLFVILAWFFSLALRFSRGVPKLLESSRRRIR